VIISVSAVKLNTALLQMSTPEAGGATVFPEHKVALFPSKVDRFWFLWKFFPRKLTEIYLPYIERRGFLVQFAEKRRRRHDDSPRRLPGSDRHQVGVEPLDPRTRPGVPSSVRLGRERVRIRRAFFQNFICLKTKLLQRFVWFFKCFFLRGHMLVSFGTIFLTISYGFWTDWVSVTRRSLF